MIDDDKKMVPAEHGDEARYGEALVYDLAKFLTTMSLLAIGGVLTIIETADRSDIKTGNIIMITVALAAATVVAASTAVSIAYARSSGQPVPSNLHRYITATMALLSIGLGMFLFMWIDKLN